MSDYNLYMYKDDGPVYSRSIMKGFLNNFEHTGDAIFYLIKGLEMIHHELLSQEVNAKDKDYLQQNRIMKLQRAIDELKGTA